MIVTENEIENELKKTENLVEIEYEILFKDMNELLFNMIDSAKNGELECDLSSIFEKLKYENNNIYRIYQKNNKLSEKDIKNFQYLCNIIFNNISWIWKRDNDINKRIIKIIKNN